MSEDGGFVVSRDYGQSIKMQYYTPQGTCYQLGCQVIVACLREVSVQNSGVQNAVSHKPRGAFLFHNFFASSSDARSYDLNGIFLACKMRRRYSKFGATMQLLSVVPQSFLRGIISDEDKRHLDAA